MRERRAKGGPSTAPIGTYARMGIFMLHAHSPVSRFTSTLKWQLVVVVGLISRPSVAGTITITPNWLLTTAEIQFISSTKTVGLSVISFY